MPFVDFNGRKLEVNEEGFLAHPEEWNEEIARFFALEEEGIENLTEDHWAVINYIREYYLEKNIAPMVRKVCKTTGLKLKQIYGLFPSGPAKGAAKIAGLPKPDGCV
jgi:tRNA 2-thiouridine synthesizing protein E